MVQGSFQMKVWTLMIQSNLMIPDIPWFQLDNPKVYGDTSISDGLVGFGCQLTILLPTTRQSFEPSHTQIQAKQLVASPICLKPLKEVLSRVLEWWVPPPLEAALPTPSKTDHRIYHSTLSTRSYLAFALSVALALQLLLGSKWNVRF